MAEDADAANAHDLAPAGRRGRGIWSTILVWAPLLLVLGTILHTIAIFLPWENIAQFNGALGGSERVDVYVYTRLISNPGFAYSELTLGVTVGLLLARVTASTLWQAAIPLTGVFLLLAYFTFCQPALRWLTLTLYAFWLVWLSAIANYFIQRLSDVKQDTVPGLPAWLRSLLNVGITVSSPEQPRPGWGFWVLVAGLVISWLAWALALVAQWRGLTPRDEAEPTPQQDSSVGTSLPSRTRLLGPILITVGALLWGLSLLALPDLFTDCGNVTPLPPPREVASCQASSGIYPLQIVALTPFAEHRDALGTDYRTLQLYGFLIYMRDFTPIALALVVAPFALIAAWRNATRLRAICITIWVVLLAAILLVVIRATALVMNPPPNVSLVKSAFNQNIGPAPFVMGLGIVVIGVGLASVWLRAVIRPQKV